MTKLKEWLAWAERWGVYAALILFAILQILSIIIPSLKPIFDRRGEILLVTIILFFIFRYLDGKLGTLDKQALETYAKLKTLDEPVLKISNRFLDGLREILCEEKYYENVDVIAHTGVVYVDAILRGCETRIKNLRVLIKDARSVENISLPDKPQDKCKLRTEWRHAQTEWEQLRRNMLEGTPQITNLWIKCYPFDPMMTFIIIDRKKAYFDLMTPQTEFPGSTSAHDPTSYTVTDRTEGGRRLINNMSIVFNHMWDDFR